MKLKQVESETIELIFFINIWRTQKSRFDDKRHYLRLFYQIKFIAAIDQISVLRNSISTKETQKRILVSHIARISSSVTNFHRNRFLYNKTKEAAETSSWNGRNLSQTFFCLFSCYLFSFCSVFFPSHAIVFSILYTHFFIVQYLSKWKKRWDRKYVAVFFAFVQISWRCFCHTSGILMKKEDDENVIKSPINISVNSILNCSINVLPIAFTAY